MEDYGWRLDWMILKLSPPPWMIPWLNRIRWPLLATVLCSARGHTGGWAEGPEEPSPEPSAAWGAARGSPHRPGRAALSRLAPSSLSRSLSGHLSPPRAPYGLQDEGNHHLPSGAPQERWGARPARAWGAAGRGSPPGAAPHRLNPQYLPHSPRRPHYRLVTNSTFTLAALITFYL